MQTWKEKLWDIWEKFDFWNFLNESVGDWEFWVTTIGAVYLLAYQLPLRIIKRRNASRDARVLRNQENRLPSKASEITDLYVATRFVITVLPTPKNPHPTPLKKTGKKLIPWFLKQFKNEKQKYYLIIADSGMGKTTFLRNLFLAYYRKFGDKKTQLKYFHLSNPNTWKDIDLIENKENVMLLLDAFDEDAEALKNYSSRMNMMYRQLEKFSKVIISSRRQLFTSPQDLPARTEDKSIVTEQFHRFIILEILPFSQRSRNAYLRKCFPYRNPFTIYKNYRKRRQAKEMESRLDTLMARPLILSFIKELLEEDQAFYTTTDIFNTIIDKWSFREREKKGIHEQFPDLQDFKAAHHLFHKDIALQMFHTKEAKGSYYIHKDEKVDTKSILHITDVTEQEDTKKGILPIGSSNARHRSLLTRVNENYMFIHASMMEYYLAEEAKQNYDFLIRLDLSILDAGLIFLNDHFIKQQNDSPNDYRVLHGLAMVHYARNNTNTAIPLFEKAIALQQESPYLYFHLGRLYHFQDDYDKSIPLLKKAEALGIEEADNFFYLGYASEDMKDYSSSIPYYKRVIQINPDHLHAHNNLGTSYAFQTQYKNAVDCFEKAVMVNPDDHIAYRNMGLAYARQERYTEAINSYKKAIELQPDYSHAYYSLGNAYYSQEQYPEAVNSYKKAIELQADYQQAYLSLGNTYLSLEQYTEAINNYKKAISLQPNDHQVHHNLGLTYATQEKYDEAINSYKKTIELQPDDDQTYHNLGLIYHYQEQYTEAINNYKKAIELQPNDYQVHHNLGLVYATQEKYNEAINSYKKAIELQPDGDQTYHNLGLTYHYQEQYTEAINNYKKAIELQPNDDQAYHNLGLAYYDQEQYTEAINNYKKAIELQPNDYQTYHNLGNAYVTQEQYIEAIDNYKKAISLQPNDHQTHQNMGLIYATQEKYVEAIHSYEKAIELQPNDFQTYLNLGNAYIAQEKYMEAINCYEKLLASNPEEINGWLLIGWVYLLMHNYDKSEESFLKIWNKENQVAHYSTPMNLGHIYLLRKDNDQAMSWYQKAVNLCKEDTVFKEFMEGMDQDYIDLKMEEHDISKTAYQVILEKLKNER